MLTISLSPVKYSTNQWVLTISLSPVNYSVLFVMLHLKNFLTLTLLVHYVFNPLPNGRKKVEIGHLGVRALKYEPYTMDFLNESSPFFQGHLFLIPFLSYFDVNEPYTEGPPSPLQVHLGLILNGVLRGYAMAWLSSFFSLFFFSLFFFFSTIKTFPTWIDKLPDPWTWVYI